MTAWRVGVAIKPESVFGVEDTGETWHYIGVGLDMNFSMKNGWKFQGGMGSKTPELEFEGRFSGTWGGNLYLGYNNIYWLQFGLEGYGFKTEDYHPVDDPTSTKTRGVHKFTTANNKALKSFSLRFLKLDREVGNPDDFDEEIILLGCTMNKVSPTYEGSSTSAIKVSVGGSFVDTKLTAKDLTDTITPDVISSKNLVKPVEWGCLEVISEDGTEWEAIANNERTGFTISRQINTVPSCGSRIDSAYYESAISAISVTSQIYSRNPNQWQTRMHSGGIRNDITKTAPNNVSQPRRKGLQPCPNIRIASGTIIDETNDVGPDYSCIVDFIDVVVDGWGNTYNSNSEITESPQLNALKGVITIKTPVVTESIKGEDYLAIVDVTYNANGGNKTPLKMSYLENDTIIVAENKGTKSGYKFTGWSDGTNVYQPGSMYQLYNTDVTFTAQWTAVE